MTCGNCEQDFDPIRFRWRCPFCGWKESCCDGAPQTAPRVEVATTVMQVPVEFTACVRCTEPILRLPGGLWEHLDVGLDADHDPAPDLDELSDRRLEARWEAERIDVPTHTVVAFVEQLPVSPPQVPYVRPREATVDVQGEVL